MSYSAPNDSARQPERDAQEQQGSPAIPDRSFVDSLKRIVRRVLRTQSCRTSFEARVLDEARHLLESCEMARDTLERLVVDRLLGSRHEGRMDLAAQGAGALCPPTQLSVSHSTFARRSTAD
jgi:hypothetical protein